MGRKRTSRRKRLRVAIVLDLDWPYKRQVEAYEGIVRFAAGHPRWDSMLIPIAEGGEPAANRHRAALAFDGIIARASAELAAAARSKGIPLVNLWLNSPAEDVVSVLPDCDTIARTAAGHLIARGLRNLGFMGMRRIRESALFYGALKEEAGACGARLSRLLIQQNYNRNEARWNEFQDSLGRWIDSWRLPFGAVVGTDLLARYVIEACLRRGLKVPEDVAVIGQGNEQPLCLQPEPTLTSMDYGYVQIGYRAAEMLNTMMEGGRIEVGEYLHRNVQLVARHSTDVFAVEDEIVASALRYISENCQRPIGVDDVAEQVPVSRRSLERRFEVAIGRSIAGEINRMRVRRAQRFLVETKERLSVIAEHCGFNDSEHMRRNFVRYAGTNPAQYRAEAEVGGG